MDRLDITNPMLKHMPRTKRWHYRCLGASCRAHTDYKYLLQFWHARKIHFAAALTLDASIEVAGQPLRVMFRHDLPSLAYLTKIREQVPFTSGPLDNIH